MWCLHSWLTSFLFYLTAKGYWLTSIPVFFCRLQLILCACIVSNLVWDPCLLLCQLYQSTYLVMYLLHHSLGFYRCALESNSTIFLKLTLWRVAFSWINDVMSILQIDAPIVSCWCPHSNDIIYRPFAFVQSINK